MKTHRRSAQHLAWYLLGGLATSSFLSVSCGGSDLSCGTGTKKSGSKCVAVEAIEEDGGGTGGSGGDGTGGTEGSGGATSGSGGATPGAGGSGDAGPSTDVITFAGITGAAPVNDSSILVTWAPASYPRERDAVIRYEVHFSESSPVANFAVPVEAPPGATSAIVEGLDAGKTYYFVVRAVADRGSARDTNTVEKSAAPAADTTSPTFSGVREASPAGPGSVLVQWDAADDGTGSPPETIVYRVYWAPTANDPLQLGAITDPGVTQIEVKGLPDPETTYYFNVVAVDAAGNVAENDNRVPGTTGPDTKPPVFSGCRATLRVTAGGGEIVWDPAVDDTTTADDIEYQIYAFQIPVDRTIPFEDITPTATVKGQTSMLVTGLKEGTHYRLVCRAVDAHANQDQNIRTLQIDTPLDGDPPTFSGIKTESHAATEVTLSWDPATDGLSPQSGIVYNVYAAMQSGQQDFTRPIAVSNPGASSRLLVKEDLLKAVPAGERASNQEYYFVVRAQDEAGNTDPNTIEVLVKTLVSFADDIELIMSGIPNDPDNEARCARLGCHTDDDPGTPPLQGQNLDKGVAWDNIVNVIAREGAAIGNANIKRVDPTPYTNPPDVEYRPNDPDFNRLMKSYLWRKITNNSISGSQMPPAIAGVVLTPAEIQTITDWILQGAQRN